MAEWLIFLTLVHEFSGLYPTGDRIQLMTVWHFIAQCFLLPSFPPPGRQHSLVEIDHEIFSTVVLSLSLIQEGQLSVSGERMCTILVNRLED